VTAQPVTAAAPQTSKARRMDSRSSPSWLIAAVAHPHAGVLA
jgi:hypothetical protein